MEKGLDVAVINESGIENDELASLIFYVYGRRIKVVNPDSIKPDDYSKKKGIVLLHSDSDIEHKDLDKQGVMCLVGEKGISVNVLITVGVHKLISGTITKEILIRLGYTDKEIRAMGDLANLQILPPVASVLPLIKDLILINRTIDISA